MPLANIGFEALSGDVYPPPRRPVVYDHEADVVAGSNIFWTRVAKSGENNRSRWQLVHTLLDHGVDTISVGGLLPFFFALFALFALFASFSFDAPWDKDGRDAEVVLEVYLHALRH